MRRGKRQAVSVEVQRRVAPWLSGWERWRVTISLMRAGRPAVLGESWAGSCTLRPSSWPALRTPLSRVWWEGQGERSSEGDLGRWAPWSGGRGTKSRSPRCGCPGNPQETPKWRKARESEWPTAPMGRLCAPCPGKEPPRRPREVNQTHGPLIKPIGPAVSGAAVQFQPHMDEDPTVLAEVTSTLQSGSRDALFPMGPWNRGAIAAKP